MMANRSPPIGQYGVSLSAADVVNGYHNLVEVEPKSASAHLDHMAETVESCRAARVKFVDAVADLIVALPPEGARYPAQVLADLVEDDAMVVREKAAEAVADLAAVLGPAHLCQCESLFAAAGQQLGSDNHKFVREQACSAWLTYTLAHDGIGLHSVARAIAFLKQTLPGSVANALERAMERLSAADAPIKSAPPTG